MTENTVNQKLVEDIRLMLERDAEQFAATVEALKQIKAAGADANRKAYRKRYLAQIKADAKAYREQQKAAQAAPNGDDKAKLKVVDGKVTQVNGEPKKGKKTATA